MLSTVQYTVYHTDQSSLYQKQALREELYKKLLWQSAGLNPTPAELNLISFQFDNFIFLLMFESIFNLIGYMAVLIWIPIAQFNLI